jgi:MerR family transcriptional regulator/heat shock protein HspR
VERLNLVIELTKDLGVNKAGVDIILRMRSRLELMHREISDLMGLLDEDIRKEFERRLKSMFGKQ